MRYGSPALLAGLPLLGLTGRQANVRDTIEGPSGVSDKVYAVGINVTNSGAVIQSNLFRNFYRQRAAKEDLVGEGVPIILNAGAVSGLVEQTFWSTTTPKRRPLAFLLERGGGHVIRTR